MSVKFPSQFLVQEKHIYKILASFDKNFYQLSMNSIIDAAKFESEPRFENNLNKIKDNHLKSITSIAMNLIDITSNKTSSSSEHLKSNLMPCIPLQPPGKSPQFTKHLPSMHPKGNTQLQIRKW